MNHHYLPYGAVSMACRQMNGLVGDHFDHEVGHADSHACVDIAPDVLLYKCRIVALGHYTDGHERRQQRRSFQRYFVLETESTNGVLVIT